MNEFDKNYREEFKDRETRQIYADDFLDTSVATQIKVLREQREWTQQQLAEKAEMAQERISVMEDVNYSSWTIKTLRRLAHAYDLRLVVKFESFGSLLSEFEAFSRETLEKPSFDDDPAFADEAIAAAFGTVKTYFRPRIGLPIAGVGVISTASYAPAFDIVSRRVGDEGFFVFSIKNPTEYAIESKKNQWETYLNHWRSSAVTVISAEDARQQTLFAHPDLDFENILGIGNLGYFKEGSSTSIPDEVVTELLQ